MMNKEVYYKMLDFDTMEWDSFHEELITSPDVTVDNDLIDELVYMVYVRFFEMYVYKKEIDWTSDDYSLTADDYTTLRLRFTNIINMTYERYAPMLVFQRANESDPSPKLESESNGKTRFNDTPQNEALASNEFFNDDKHSTNITASHSSTSVDSGTVAERLDELYKNWKSILRNWTDEFKGLFMEVWR